MQKDKYMAYIPADLRATGEAASVAQPATQNPFVAAENVITAMIASQTATDEINGYSGNLNPQNVKIEVAGGLDAEAIKIRLTIGDVDSIGVTQVASKVEQALVQIPIIAKHFATPINHMTVSEIKQQLEQLVASNPELASNPESAKIMSWGGFNDKRSQNIYDNTAAEHSVNEDEKNRVVFSVITPKNDDVVPLKEITANVEGRKEAIKQEVFAEAMKHKEMQGLSLDDTEILISDSDSKWSQSLSVTFGVKKDPEKAEIDEIDDLTETPLAQLDRNKLQEIIGNAVVKTGEKAEAVYGSLANEKIVKADIKKLFTGKNLGDQMESLLDNSIFIDGESTEEKKPSISINIGSGNFDEPCNKDEVKVTLQTPKDMKATDFVKQIASHAQALTQQPSGQVQQVEHMQAVNPSVANVGMAGSRG